MTYKTIYIGVALLRTVEQYGTARQKKDKTFSTNAVRTTSEPTDFVLVTGISQNSILSLNQHSPIFYLQAVIR